MEKVLGIVNKLKANIAGRHHTSGLVGCGRGYKMEKIVLVGTVSGRSSVDAGGLSMPRGQTVEAGQSGTEVTAVADSGAVFEGRSDGVSTASRTDTEVQSDLELPAQFRSECGVEIDWYADHGIATEEEANWADLDSMDFSGKGMTLAEEFIAGTDPNDPQSRFVSSPPVVEGAGFEIHFEPSLPERRYSLFRSTDLAPWNSVPGMQNVPGGDGPMVDSDPPDEAAFYRI